MSLLSLTLVARLRVGIRCRHGQIRGLIVLLSKFWDEKGQESQKRAPTVGFGPQGAPRNVPGFYVALVQAELRLSLLGGVLCVVVVAPSTKQMNHFSLKATKPP